MSNTSYSPGLGNLPYGNRNTNPQGSFYGVESEYNPTELNLIRKAIYDVIFDAAPAQFDTLKLVFSKPFEDVPSDEFEYLEKTFGRSPIVANGNTAAAAAAPGAHQTQTLTLTTASMSRITPDLIIVYPDGVTHAVVTAITGGNTITVNSLTNEGLPAVATNDVFAIQSTIRADGMTSFSNYERTDVITRYNYVQFFLRAKRWATIELQKYINLGTTNYLEVDKAEKLKQLRIDLFNSFWNGKRGEYTISGGYAAKAMGGIYPTMLAAGSATPSTTVAGLQSTFEATAFQTNFKAEGATRFIYGTDEILNEFSKIYKQPGLRYEPNNETANLKLKRIELGTQNFVLVPCELWREESCFSADWARRVIVLDQESVRPVKMKGIPAMNMGQTGDLSKGFYNDFIDYWNTAQMSLKFNNPVASFAINIL
jgi:hypothetical protein